jgi:hypothetical protein
MKCSHFDANAILPAPPRLRSLAAGLASVLGVAGVAAWPADTVAAPVYVQNCADNGAGSLRDAIAAATDNDIVVLANLPCSTITLSGGALNATHDFVTLTGPGPNKLSIASGGQFRVFHHTGTGELSITGLTIRDGKYVSDTNPRGGCIYSASNVRLVDATVGNCVATGSGGAEARGGGIYARNAISLTNSTITGNTALGTQIGSKGGGVYLRGSLAAKESIFSDNYAASGPVAAGVSVGGAFWVAGSAYLLGSLVSGNKAGLGAAISIEPNGINASLRIVNSTVSENLARYKFGGIYAKVPVTLANSTIAFNSAPSGGAVYSVLHPLQLQSSIIADNATGGSPGDLDGALNPPISGYNNLITSSTIGFPLGTIKSCPKLGPLASNSDGAMLTHALLSSSPAINAGNNPLQLPTDQRGFSRTTFAQTDIGAYERQGTKDDRLMVGGFESICDH